MTKIEPMTLERLKEKLAEWNETPEAYAVEFEMALAWIEAEAELRFVKQQDAHIDNQCGDQCSEMCDRNLADWIAAVEKEVGWLEDK